MIYRGCCDRFMCFRQPSERWRHVHQGYWALSSFTLEEKEEAHALSQSVPHKTGPYNLRYLFELVNIWFWSQLINLKELYGEFVLYFSSSPIISSRADELRELPWQQLDWLCGFVPTIPFFLCWVIYPLQPATVAMSGWENQIWANYHYGLLYSGRTLINSPPGLDTMNDWSLQRSLSLPQKRITMK